MAELIASQSRSLLDLPPEIWSHIGRFAVDEAPTLSTWVLRDIQDCRTIRARSAVIKSTEQPPITRTCRALRDELLPFYYRSKINIQLEALGIPWVVLRPTPDYRLLVAWLWAIGKDNRRNVRGVCRRFITRGPYASTHMEVLKERLLEAMGEQWQIEAELVEVKVEHSTVQYMVKFL